MRRTPLEVGGEVLADEHAIKASSRVAKFCGKVIFLVWLGMKLCTWMVRVFAQLRSTTEQQVIARERAVLHVLFAEALAQLAATAAVSCVEGRHRFERLVSKLRIVGHLAQPHLRGALRLGYSPPAGS